MSKDDDVTISYLIHLNGEKFVIDEVLGLWVKFEVIQVKKTKERPHGIKYSLSLHDRSNKRIMGFDNAHAIKYGAKNQVAPKRAYYHWHKNENDEGRPYNYTHADKLLEDFWAQVDLIIKK